MGNASFDGLGSCGSCSSSGLQIGRTRRSSIDLSSEDSQCPCQCSDGLAMGARRGFIDVLQEAADPGEKEVAGRELIHPLARYKKEFTREPDDRCMDDEKRKEDDVYHFHEAVRTGDYQGVVDLVSRGANPYSRTARGQTAAMLVACSCMESTLAIVDFLTDTGLNLEAVDKNGWTALMYACQNNNAEVAMHLLDRGSHINAATTDGVTPLMLVIAESNIELMCQLLTRNAQANLKDEKGETPMFYACTHSTPEVVKTLLKHKANPFSKSRAGMTPLMACCQQGNIKVATTLVRMRADIDCKTKSHQTPLTFALEAALPKMADWLLDQMAEVDYKTEHGVTPWKIAEQRGLLSMKTRIDKILKTAEIEAKEKAFKKMAVGIL